MKHDSGLAGGDLINNDSPIEDGAALLLQTCSCQRKIACMCLSNNNKIKIGNLESILHCPSFFFPLSFLSVAQQAECLRSHEFQRKGDTI